MLSDMQRLSKGLIIYSVLLSDYEKLDFKNDALAGVRANYFNSRCYPQEDRTEVLLDERMYYLNYSMREDWPLLWKMTRDKRPYQTVTRLGESYCVLSYGDNGLVFKKQFFDRDHNWLRSEYYDPEREGVLCGSVALKMHNGIAVLTAETISPEGGRVRRRLYPSKAQPSKRCAGLVYSNCGMVWYDTDFAPEGQEETAAAESAGFGLTPEDFTADREERLELRSAEYLTAEACREAVSEPQPEEEKPYSAYDKIERILYEAHKTNKNLFGELADYSEDEPDEKEPETTESEPEEEPVTDTPEPEEPAAEETEAAAEPAVPEEPVLEIASEPEPDREIVTENGAYSYYGALDENGGRTGRGRTAAPGGATSYDGEYLEDKRHGFGVCYYRDGSPNYIGGWNMGARCGSGVGYRRSDGTLHVGRWENNKAEGGGARFDSEGGFIEAAMYSGGVKNGKSLSFDSDGSVVIGYWRNGELVGERTITDAVETEEPWTI